MRTLLAILLFAAVGFGQAPPAQGPPPKNLTKLPDGHFTANHEPENSENFELHVVVAGDTLSAIAGQTLKEPKLWPQLWEANDHIVNPHWIYPNDKILIKPIVKISDAAPPTVPAPPPPPPPAPRVPFQLNVQPPPAPPEAVRTTIQTVPLRNFPEVKAGDVMCSGFIRSAPVPDNMRVVAKFNSDNGVVAGEGDYIYVGQGLAAGIKVGATYQIIRPTRNIDSPHLRSDRKRGMHYLDVAQIRIVMTQDNFSLARVLQGCDGAEVGDLIIPFEQGPFPALPSKRPFSPTMRASGQARGNVIATKGALLNFGSVFRFDDVIPGVRTGSLKTYEHGVVGEGGIVYLDLGRPDGVKPGDLFIVFRNVEVEDDAVVTDRKKIANARTAIGEVVILKVDDRAATALVTYSTVGVSLEDSVERR